MHLWSYVIHRVIGMGITLAVAICLFSSLLYFEPGGGFHSLPQGYPIIGAHSLITDLMQTMLQAIRNVFTLQWGFYPGTFKPLLPILLSELGVSAIIFFGSYVIALAIGIPLGVAAALHRGRWVDNCATLLASAGQPLTNVAGPPLAILFGAIWPILPIYGWRSPLSPVLPAFALSLMNIGIAAMFVRGGLIESFREEYHRTALGKGLSRLRITVKHLLPISLSTMFTMLSAQVNLSFMQLMIVEKWYGMPGLSTAFTDPMSGTSLFSGATLPQNVVVSAVVVGAILVLAVNFAVDLLQRMLDPRVLRA